MGIIQDLIDEGALVLHLDLRAGHARDLSGHGNHGTPTDVQWTRDGARFPAATSMITVADAAELQGDEWALVAYSAPGFMSQIDTETLAQKRDAGGTQWDWYLTATPGVELYDGTNTRNKAGSIVGARCLGLNVSDGATGDQYVDGILDGALSAASSISSDDAPMTIGNTYGGGEQLQSTLSAIAICSRQLTATEMAQVYAELSARTWPSMPIRRWSAWDTSGDTEGWGAEWGIHVDSAVASGRLGGSPLEIISGGGNVGVTTDTIEGETVKVVEGSGATVVGMRVQEPHDEAAYGTWDFWLKRGSSSQHPDVVLFGDAWTGLGGAQNGYALTWTAAEAIELDKRTGGSGSVVMKTDSSYLTGTDWHRFRVTRSAAGEWTVYVDGVALDVTGGSGTNPATENTHTTGQYITVQLESGDAIAWAGIGRTRLAKMKGVVAP